jgi:hypothetical protein
MKVGPTERSPSTRVTARGHALERISRVEGRVLNRAVRRDAVSIRASWRAGTSGRVRAGGHRVATSSSARPCARCASVLACDGRSGTGRAHLWCEASGCGFVLICHGMAHGALGMSSACRERWAGRHSLRVCMRPWPQAGQRVGSFLNRRRQARARSCFWCRGAGDVISPRSTRARQRASDASRMRFESST